MSFLDAENYLSCNKYWKMLDLEWGAGIDMDKVSKPATSSTPLTSAKASFGSNINVAVQNNSRNTLERVPSCYEDFLKDKPSDQELSDCSNVFASLNAICAKVDQIFGSANGLNETGKYHEARKMLRSSLKRFPSLLLTSASVVDVNFGSCASSTIYEDDTSNCSPKTGKATRKRELFKSLRVLTHSKRARAAQEIHKTRVAQMSLKRICDYIDVIFGSIDDISRQLGLEKPNLGSNKSILSCSEDTGIYSGQSSDNDITVTSLVNMMGMKKHQKIKRRKSVPRFRISCNELSSINTSSGESVVPKYSPTSTERICDTIDKLFYSIEQLSLDLSLLQDQSPANAKNYSKKRMNDSLKARSRSFKSLRNFWSNLVEAN